MLFHPTKRYTFSGLTTGNEYRIKLEIVSDAGTSDVSPTVGYIAAAKADAPSTIVHSMLLLYYKVKRFPW